MRNLIIFLRRYFNLILFLALEIICLSLIFKKEGYQQTVYVNSANAVSGFFLKRLNTARDYFHLRSFNDSLVSQNTLLLNRLAGLETQDTISALSPDSAVQFHYYAARIVNNSVTLPFNYITIDRGSKDGIRPRMGVIGPSGVVGIVWNVSRNYAVVTSLLNKKVKVSAMLAKDGDAGSVIWNRNKLDARYGSLIDIPKDAKVVKGDSIVTSGYSAIFPKGLLIGYVEDIGLRQTSNFFDIKMKFATNFNSLQYVYVIKDSSAPERLELEKESRDE